MGGDEKQPVKKNRTKVVGRKKPGRNPTNCSIRDTDYVDGIIFYLNVSTYLI